MRDSLVLLAINILTWIIVAFTLGVVIYEQTQNVNVKLCIEAKSE